MASFQKAPLLLCRSFEDDAFTVQPERDPELHAELVRMWLRRRDSARCWTLPPIMICIILPR